MLFAEPPQPKRRVFLRRKPDLTAPAQRGSEGTPARTACGWFWAPFTTKRYITGECETLGKADWNICNMKEHENSIYIKGARVHNLRNIEVEIPHNKLIVVTGLSGSGKSTLAFDTIFRRGQRRYVESLSAYAGSSSGRSTNPTWTSSRASRRPSPSSRRSTRAIPVRRWVPRPKYTTT